MTTLEKVGREIRSRRIQARMTQAELAQAAGCSHGTILSVEQGRGCLLSVLDNIAEALDARVEIVDGYRPTIVYGNE